MLASKSASICSIVVNVYTVSAAPTRQPVQCYSQCPRRPACPPPRNQRSIPPPFTTKTEEPKP